MIQGKQGYRVSVLFDDGSWIDFYAYDSYETTGQGAICVWQDVSIEGKFYDFYSIPTSKIKTIKEVDLDKK